MSSPERKGFTPSSPLTKKIGKVLVIIGSILFLSGIGGVILSIFIEPLQTFVPACILFIFISLFTLPIGISASYDVIAWGSWSYSKTDVFILTGVIGALIAIVLIAALINRFF